ncbi:MAG TPA: winged helix-turn-helix domain-containing protein [Rhodothermales bacterium]|nr:winged helix-turn-helix domain-containing protein [Rhodothermales bacterium]
MLLLVTDDAAMEAAVRLSTGDVTVEVFPFEGITDARGVLGDVGRRIVEAAERAEAVLVQFALERAPVLNTLGYHLRRRLDVPLVALCLGGPEDRVAALAAGADDAVGLPLHLARVQVRGLAHRRLVEAARLHGGTRPTAPDLVEVGPLKLDRASRHFAIGDRTVALTPREFALLNYLLAHSDTVVTRDEILDAVWGLAFDTGTNMVDVYVYFLRRKLEAFGVRDIIQTVRGRGYRLVPPKG